MFGPRFTDQAQDLPVGWAAIEQLKAVHRKSYVTVLRRYVEHGRELPLAGMVATAYWDPLPEDQDTRCRHYVRSAQFERLFPSVAAEELRAALDAHTIRRRGGPVGTFALSLLDCSGRSHEFVAEAFYNSHYVLALFRPLKAK
jgi:hypothetical protein